MNVVFFWCCHLHSVSCCCLSFSGFLNIILGFTAQSILTSPIFIKMSYCWLKLLWGGAATCYNARPTRVFVRDLKQKIPSSCHAVSYLEFLPLLMQEHGSKGFSKCVSSWFWLPVSISLSIMAVTVPLWQCRGIEEAVHMCAHGHACSGGIKQCRVNTLCFKVSFFGGGGKRYVKVKGKH